MPELPMEDRLVGSWNLFSYVQSFDDGRADVLPMGAAPSGLILYTSDGHMSAQLGPADRAAFASDVITDGTTSEYAGAARTYIAYSGRYSCDPEFGCVTHHVQVSVSRTGSEAIRCGRWRSMAMRCA